MCDAVQSITLRAEVCSVCTVGREVQMQCLVCIDECRDLCGVISRESVPVGRAHVGHGERGVMSESREQQSSVWEIASDATFARDAYTVRCTVGEVVSCECGRGVEWGGECVRCLLST